MSTLTTPDSDGGLADLTAFQRDMLWVLANNGGALYGLAIKGAIEAYYGEEINHGRLYPNLDTLAESGYITVSKRDERTNDYALTTQARQALSLRQAWEEGTA